MNMLYLFTVFRLINETGHVSSESEHNDRGLVQVKEGDREWTTLCDQ